MKCIVALFLVVSGLFAQAPARSVDVTVVPVTMDVKKALFGDIKGVGLWTVYVAHSSAEPENIVVPTSAIFMAASDIGFISRPLAVRLFQNGGNRGKLAVAAQIISFGTDTGAGLLATGTIKAAPPILQGFVIAIPVVRSVADWLNARKDSYGEMEQFICPDTMVLAPRGQAGAYGECMVFARIQSGVKPHSYTLTLQ